MTETASTARIEPAEARKVAFAAFVGTALEWYDYFLYGTAASIVFDRLYFATEDPAVATLAAFASFAVGFVARPLGGVVFGHLGDRIGRRRCLLITVTLISVVTGVIGLLPDFVTIGLAAPLLLTALRVLQGVAVGGEWGGAVTLAVEHAPPEQRGRFAALPQIGSPVGTLLSSGGFYLVAMLPDESFDSWGWRLPFLAAFPLLGVALWLRRRVGESPVFEQVLAEHDRASVPAVELFRTAWRQVLIGVAASLIGIGGFYLLTTFVISYGSGQLGLPKSLMLAATLVAAAVEVLTLIFGGRLADRFSPGKVCLWGGVLSAAMAFPVFWMIDTRNPVLVIIAVTLGINCLSIPYAVSGSLLASLFPVHLRYSGVAISSNLSGMISGFVPLIASALLIASGQESWSTAALLLVLALITAAGGLFGHRAARTPTAEVLT
ncbi:MFS transporter [Saccharopolyspora rhizosphaerae]|uniref:MFS transporter n=1 Tax=Saccharopolyspora rhizosphaerae TaxID=2492662 RepID=A0A3R8Q6W2_9PSEU|nr:MFS transporter [Saccharopolyspora rhizosphaerae]RRO18246.1 MFS transporter [Saccharopolyspora rhizosphaerae]